MPSDDILRRAHEAELNKMLGLIAVWFTFFIGLTGIFLVLLGKPEIKLELWAQPVVIILGFVLAIGDGCLTMAILGKFQELVFLERQKPTRLASFYWYLKQEKVPFLGARIWDVIVRKVVLGISEKELNEEFLDRKLDYTRMNKGLTATMFVVWVILILMSGSIFFLAVSR